VLQKVLYKSNPSFSFLDNNDEPFDVIISLKNRIDIYIKFRESPTKTDLERINKNVDNEVDQKRVNLYIHMKDEYNKNFDFTKYNKRIDFEDYINIEKLYGGNYGNIFYGSKVFEELHTKYPVDYYLYYDESKEISFDDIDSYSNDLKIRLINDFKVNNRIFSFVLGAGVSYDYNIPMWDDLLNKNLKEIKAKTSYNEAYIFEKIGDTSLIKAQFVVDNLNDDASSSAKEYKFCQSMKKDFYPTVFKPINPSSLRSIAKCIEVYKSYNRGVITYNYDDLLENTINHETSLSYQTIYKDDEIDNKDVNIYHVHGYLPRIGHLKSEHSKSIILSEQKYNYLFNNPLSWQITNQLTRFRENLCVLVGLSISDPSLRRLLENVKMSNPMKFHYAILARVSHKHISTLKDTLAITKHFERIGVHIIWVDNYSDIPNVIDSLYT
jgi:hypothetical protein